MTYDIVGRTYDVVTYDIQEYRRNDVAYDIVGVKVAYDSDLVCGKNPDEMESESVTRTRTDSVSPGASRRRRQPPGRHQQSGECIFCILK